MLRIFKQYYPIRNVLFIIGEGVLIYTAVLLSFGILMGGLSSSINSWVLLKALLIMMVCQLCIYYNDLYDLQVADSYSELGIRLMQALGAASILLAGVYLVFPEAIIGQGVFLVSTAIAILLIVLWRFGYKIILTYGLFNENIILLGTGDLSEKIISEIEEKKDCGYSIEMVVPEKGSDQPIKSYSKEINSSDCELSYKNLCQLAKKSNIKKIVVAIQQRRGAFPLNELLECRVEGFNIIEGNTFYEMLTGKLIVDQINPAWLIFSAGFKKSLRKRTMKRVVDILLSLTLLLLLLPLNIVVAICIKLESKGPVIFSQDRVGEKRKIYTMHKFRSMVQDAEKKSGPVWASEEDDRITRVGRIIRKLRIDEIPQLWNVLKGEMSFVGPRPERDHFVKQLEENIPYFGERFTVKPGLTGWAQVSYGYGASIEDAKEKLNYDLFYTKNFSILMDLMIVMKTVKIVLFGKGAR